MSLAKTSTGLFAAAALFISFAQSLFFSAPSSESLVVTQQASGRSGSTAAKVQAEEWSSQSNGHTIALYNGSNSGDYSGREPSQHIDKPIERVDSYQEASPQHIGTALVREDTYGSEEGLHIGANFQRVDDFSRSADAQHIGLKFNREDDYSVANTPQRLGPVFNREDE